MYYQIPPFNNPNKEQVVFWENFLTNEELNLILSQPEWHDLNIAKIGSNTESIHNENYRSSLVSWLQVKPELFLIWEKISNVVAQVNAKYFQFDLTGFYEPMQLTLYKGNIEGHYNWHTDDSVFPNVPARKLSFSMLLSDTTEYEGGEFQVKLFGDEIQTLECKKGRAWFFPSYVIHRVAPVTKGIRRSAVLWIGGPPFK
jgi:PKHD-type hydroxylase